jgi:outer membrane lipoprotein-sorting protein
MSIFSHRPTLRWSVPLVAAVVLGAGGSAVGVISATARDGLPHRTASQLLVDVQKARLDGLSGTVVQNAELGLPSLPGVGGGGSSDLSSMVSGSHTLRLWYAGPNRARLALLGSLGESDVIRNGADLWTWSSTGKSATHRSVPVTEGEAPESLASLSPITPQQAAETALKAIAPSTKVSTDGTAVVAGRSAYELLLQPRDTRSLVASVRIALDGETHNPLRVRVFADGVSEPAFEVGFTSFDPTKPAASVFSFNPPPGTKVTQAGPIGIPDRAEAGPQAKRGGPQAGSDPRNHPLAGAEPKVVGTGWTSVVVVKAPADAGDASKADAGKADADKAGAGSLSSVLRVLPKVSGSWGSGHLLRGTLFSALLTDDGRVAVGAVRPSELYAALGG